MKNFSTHLSENLDAIDEKMPEISEQKNISSQHYFYENENRNEILNKISHLVDYTKLVLFIQGKEGIGKTFVAKQCALQPSENWRTSYLSAKDTASEADLIETLINDYQLHKEPDISYNNYAQAICEKIDLLKLSEETAVLIIDDIELLDRTLIPLLSKLVFHTHDNPPLVRLVLFGQTLPEQVQKFIPQEDEQTSLKNLSLKPFSLSETREYLDLRLKSLDLDNHPLFDNSHIIAIHENSMGIPAKIDALSDELLQELSASPIHSSSKIAPPESNKQFSIMALLITTGIILLTIFMYLQESNNNEKDADLIPLEIPENDSNHSTINSIPEEQPITTTPFKSAQPTLAEIVLSDNKDNSPEKPVLTPNILDEELLEEEVKNLISEEPTIETPNTTITTAPLEAFQTPAPPEKTGISGSDLAWFKSQNKREYTIQLIATSKQEAARNFIRQHNIETEAKLLKTIRNNKDWFVVLYRSYPTRTAANISRQNLPTQLIKLGPWIRSFSDIAKHLP